MRDIITKNIVEAAESANQSLLKMEGAYDAAADVELGRQCTAAFLAGDKATLKRLLVARSLEGATWVNQLYPNEWDRRYPQDPFDGD